MLNVNTKLKFQYFVKHKVSQFLHSGNCIVFVCSLEPVGVKGPVFSTDNLINAFIRNAGQSFALLCQAQGLPVPRFRWVANYYIRFCLEPIGSKAPSFSSDIKMLGYQRDMGQNLALLCPAQGLPFPSFR